MHTYDDNDDDGDYDNDMQLSDGETSHLQSSSTRRRNSSEGANYRYNNGGEPPLRHRGFVLAAAASIASLGGITFGYDIGIISGV